MGQDIRARYLLVSLLAWAFAAVFVVHQITPDVVPTPLTLAQMVCHLMICILLLLVTWFCHKKTSQFFLGSLIMIFCLLGLVLSSRELWLQQSHLVSSFCFGSQEKIWNVILSMSPTHFLEELWASGTDCTGGHILIFGVPINLMYIGTYIVLLFATACQIRYTVRRDRLLLQNAHEY